MKQKQTINSNKQRLDLSFDTVVDREGTDALTCLEIRYYEFIVE
jgi:hypothetical protein